MDELRRLYRDDPLAPFFEKMITDFSVRIGKAAHGFWSELEEDAKAKGLNSGIIASALWNALIMLAARYECSVNEAVGQARLDADTLYEIYTSFYNFEFIALQGGKKEP